MTVGRSVPTGAPDSGGGTGADRAPRGLAERLRAPGPKRVLALDAGGLRGLLTLGYLARIESTLRRRHGREDLVLCDYFDLIGGTSTGAVIAAMLALGRSIAEVRELYLDLGRRAFRPRRMSLVPVVRSLIARFDERPLEALFREQFGERTLDSPDLRCGLAVVAKRADTASVWVLINVPGHRFWADNRHLALWQVLRASSAAPSYFRPAFLSDVGAGERAAFVDGAVSMHGSPALQLLMVANLAGYGLRWPLGEDRLMLCSVGAGRPDASRSIAQLGRITNLGWARLLIQQMMRDSGELTETVLQWMSESPTASSIDAQIRNLGGDRLGRGPLITYVRYDCELGHRALGELGFPCSARRARALEEMSAARNIPDLDRIGALAAERQVREEHFRGCFDAAGRRA